MSTKGEADSRAPHGTSPGSRSRIAASLTRMPMRRPWLTNDMSGGSDRRPESDDYRALPHVLRWNWRRAERG